jgi:hypothetical protein
VTEREFNAAWDKNLARLPSVGQPRYQEPIPRPPGRIVMRRGQRRLLCYFTTVLAIETLDPAGRVDQPLGAGIEGMAIRADFDVQLVHRRTRLKRIAACAGDYATMVFGMNSGFHFLPFPPSILSSGGGPLNSPLEKSRSLFDLGLR